MEEIDAKIKLRCDSSVNWETVNPVLAKGEPGVVIGGVSHGRIKIGDGNRTWGELPYSTSLPTESHRANCRFQNGKTGKTVTPRLLTLFQ